MTFTDPGVLEDTGTPAQPGQGIDRRAEHILKQSGYSALREIVCEAREGLITLSGCVRTHYLKQVAQATVSKVEGVHGVINRIKVDVSGPAQDPVKAAPWSGRRGNRVG